MMEKPHKLDRRVERTMALLRTALMALIVEKGYDAITIQDITDRANVARTTFYLHFKDKDDLLRRSVQALYDDIVAQHQHLIERAMTQGHLPDLEDSAADFEHVAQHEDFYRAMFLQEGGGVGFINWVRRYLAAVMHSIMPPDGDPPRLPPDMIAHALAGMEIGVISWWLENGMTSSPQEMARMMYMLSMYGVVWAAHLDVPAPEDVV